jgi:molecular chaperone HscB
MEEDKQGIAAVKTAIANVEEEIYQPVKSIVEGYQEAGTTTQELLLVKEYYYKKKYLKRILANIQ